MNTQGGTGDGGDVDVLGVHLETLRAQMSPGRFRALVTAVQTTCGLLSDGSAAPGTTPGDALPDDLCRECLSLLAVMITGRIDHHLVEVPVPGGPSGWAVPEGAGSGQGPAASRVAHSVTRWHGEQLCIAEELEGIAGASGRSPR
ncbi:hypothetical protein ACFV0B_31045 [Streptomyces xanthophaeus]|uniref:hypothetical protein n=1 Tax=Streptomyces xanthophaeus TaxID=67385 RepID=UPI0036AA8274